MVSPPQRRIQSFWIGGVGNDCRHIDDGVERPRGPDTVVDAHSHRLARVGVIIGALARHYGHADRLDAAQTRAGDKLSIDVDPLLIGSGSRGLAVRPAPARIADVIDAMGRWACRGRGCTEL